MEALPSLTDSHFPMSPQSRALQELTHESKFQFPSSCWCRAQARRGMSRSRDFSRAGLAGWFQDIAIYWRVWRHTRDNCWDIGAQLNSLGFFMCVCVCSLFLYMAGGEKRAQGQCFDRFEDADFRLRFVSCQVWVVSIPMKHLTEH